MSRREFPEKDDLVLGVIDEIESHGVYIKLYEYDDLRAYCHINEISSRWVRNIRNVVREGQRVVARVLRVRPEHNQVDVSIKKVSAEHRRLKIKEWQQFTQAINLLKFVGEELGMSLEETRDEIEDILIDHFGSLYAAFEKAALEGEEAFRGVDIDEKWITPFVQIAQKNIKIPMVDIVEEIELTCFEPNGIEVIVNALKAAARTGTRKSDVTVRTYTVGAPKYHIEVTAPDYKTAEIYLKKALEKIEAKIKGHDVIYTHHRFNS